MRVLCLLVCALLGLVAVVEGKSVIVIGSGFAGLGSAVALHNAGFNVTVLESRDRMGGRSYTIQPPGMDTWIDLGAEWIHGVIDNPITALAKKYNVSTMITDYENLSDYAANGTILPGLEERLTKEYETLMETVDYCDWSDKDVSLEEGVEWAFKKLNYSDEKMTELRFKLEDEITLDYAAPLSDLSCWNWDLDTDLDGPDYFFNKRGYKGVIDGLASELPAGSIHLNSRVIKISQSILGAGVSVSTANETFYADYVIVAVPLGVLKAGTISFSPALSSAKQKSINLLNMGLLDKVFLQFNDTAAWGGAAKDYFYYLAGGKYLGQGFTSDYGMFAENLNLYHYSDEKKILAAFITEGFAVKNEEKTDAQVQEAYMTVLRRMFPNITEPTNILVTRWWNDPNSFGSYSHIPVGATKHTMDEFIAPEGQVYFAGEHTIHQHFGTTTGAYMSGERAAKAIIASFSDKK